MEVLASTLDGRGWNLDGGGILAARMGTPRLGWGWDGGLNSVWVGHVGCGWVGPVGAIWLSQLGLC
jgi:hypothetical protein